MTRRRRQGFFWSRLHFLIRFAGLSGLLVACVGLVLMQLRGQLASWQTAMEALRAPDTVGRLVIGGACAVAAALLIEMIVGFWAASGRRSLFGFNVAIQVILAVLLLVGVNAFAFLHALRFDWTRGKEYTLPAEVQNRLRQLNDETTVVIYLRHKPAGGEGDKPDRYDFAAERKVVEKVKDLVQQLRDAGPRFRVETLDVEDEHYDERLAGLTKNDAGLRQAIEAAPGNTLFFSANGRVQAMSFDEFYRLEKVDSREANGGRGNLVLGYAGVRPIADRIFKLDEPKPRVGILVPHEALSTNGSVDLFSLAGLKKTLNAHGFEVRDVVLKRWPAGSPAADLPEDSRMTRLQHEQDVLDGVLDDEEHRVAYIEQKIKDWPRGRADELEQAQAALASHQEILKQVRRQRDEVKKDLAGIDQEAVAERQRDADLGPKLERELADCDLLLIPRQTIMPNGEPISGRNTEFFGLTADQAAAVKDFLRQGKPIFACLGPRNERSEDDPTAAGPPQPDALENMLGDLGLHFSKKAILFEGQIKIQADSEDSLLVLSTEHQAPPLQPAPDGVGGKSNPVAESLRLRARAAGQPFDLALGYPRAVYLDEDTNASKAFDPAVLTTGPDSWNDAQPFPSPRRPIPTFIPPGRKDPDNGTPEAKRRGPFPVGLAFETHVPKAWLTSAADRPAKLRIAAIGHGGAFIGKELSPSQEALLLDTSNWLLGRDDHLARPAPEWRYPRVEMNDYDQTLWLWGARLGLPLLFAYLGAVVLLLRRLR